MSQSDVSPCAAPPSQRVFQEAVRRGNTKELQSLLQNMTNCEFNVNSFGPEGQTALHQSVIDGNLELVKLLVKFGADIRLANRDGWSALHIAAFGGHQDIVLYLITKAKYSAGARRTAAHPLPSSLFDSVWFSFRGLFSYCNFFFSIYLGCTHSIHGFSLTSAQML
uniref:NOTCH regulated ankyrin repeat protein n=9 Tax=Galliformes TaxID=8976 RepID=A0A8V1A8V5_CHICK